MIFQKTLKFRFLFIICFFFIVNSVFSNDQPLISAVPCEDGYNTCQISEGYFYEGYTKDSRPNGVGFTVIQKEDGKFYYELVGLFKEGVLNKTLNDYVKEIDEAYEQFHETLRAATGSYYILDDNEERKYHKSTTASLYQELYDDSYDNKMRRLRLYSKAYWIGVGFNVRYDIIEEFITMENIIDYTMTRGNFTKESAENVDKSIVYFANVRREDGEDLYLIKTSYERDKDNVFDRNREPRKKHKIFVQSSEYLDKLIADFNNYKKVCQKEVGIFYD